MLSDLALQVARRLAVRHPDLATTEQRRANRGDRIYLDVIRNAYASQLRRIPSARGLALR